MMKGKKKCPICKKFVKWEDCLVDRKSWKVTDCWDCFMKDVKEFEEEFECAPNSKTILESIKRFRGFLMADLGAGDWTEASIHNDFLIFRKDVERIMKLGGKGE